MVWIDKPIAIIGLAIICGMNCLGTNTGAYVENRFLVLKLLSVFSIVAIALVMGALGKPPCDHAVVESS